MKDTIIIRRFKDKYNPLKGILAYQIFMLVISISIFKNPNREALEANVFLMISMLFVICLIYLHYRYDSKNVINLEVTGKVKNGK